MARFHYHVGHNMAGYMPESDVYTVATLKAARQASLADAKFDLDSAWDSWAMLTPSERRQYGVTRPTKSGSAGDYWLNFDGRADFHYWVSDRCDCQDGSDELSAE